VSETIKLALALTLVCVFSGIIISFTHSSTTPKNRSAEAAGTKVGAVAGVCARHPDRRIPSERPSSTAILDRQERTINHGVRIVVESRGYFGIIRYIAGIDEQGRIMGMKILSPVGDPGFRRAGRGTGLKKSLWNAFGGGVRKNGYQWFMEQFKGISVNKPLYVPRPSNGSFCPKKLKRSLRAVTRFSAITGATVSTRAIIAGLEKKPSNLVCRAPRRKAMISEELKRGIC